MRQKQYPFFYDSRFGRDFFQNGALKKRGQFSGDRKCKGQD